MRIGSAASGRLGVVSVFGFRENSGDGWFRIGRLEVTTVVAVIGAVMASWIGWVVLLATSGVSLVTLLALVPNWFYGGEVWRVVSWPLANGLDLWSVLTIFFFWYFGTALEQQIGRAAMAGLLTGTWASLTVAALLVGLFFSDTQLAGIGVIEFAVLLVWIAEYPNRPLFFSIPAWVLGAVLVAVQVLQYVAYGMFGSLLSLLLSLVLVAIVARRVGLLSELAWIPGRRSAGSPAHQRRPRRQHSQQRDQARRSSDQDRLDALLDQISEQGLDSLTPAQRRELMRLRDRLRRP